MLRLATKDDAGIIEELCKEFVKEIPHSFMVYEPSKVYKWFEALYGNPDALILLAEDETGTFGLLVGMIHEPLFNTRKVAHEIVWYTRPESRSKKDALHLFKAYEYWATKKGCSYIGTSTVHGWVSEDKLNKFHKKNGYRHVETAFLKEI